ncbi:hypothetical protein LCGC14_1881560 [marine sediment metagenome]|uniref:Uncharacterized protein n=1 Tax=marine sediment metagenome TaxID=412755 RepID=A0A0F9J0L1_9ZZZZ
MKLTRKKAIELCIELWTWLAETGEEKGCWPKWPEVEDKYGDIQNYCFFCEYTADKKGSCKCCPLDYYLGFKCLDKKCYYSKWDDCGSTRTCKKYAKLFLAQIKELK